MQSGGSDASIFNSLHSPSRTMEQDVDNIRLFINLFTESLWRQLHQHHWLHIKVDCDGNGKAATLCSTMPLFSYIFHTWWSDDLAKKTKIVAMLKDCAVFLVSWLTRCCRVGETEEVWWQRGCLNWVTSLWVYSSYLRAYMYIYIYLYIYIPRTQMSCFLGVDLPFYGSNLPKYGSFGF